MSICASLVVPGPIAAAMDEMRPWKTTCCGSKVENRIKREVLYSNCFLVINTITALVCAILCIKPIEGDKEIVYAFVIFEEFFPMWEPWLSWGYRAGFIMMPFLMLTGCYILIYFLTHMRFQCYILNNFLENLNSGYDTSHTEQLISDAQYQKQITKRIKFCTNRHAHILQ